MSILNVVFLSLGTILSGIFIALLFVGEKYDVMLEPLEGDDFPLKEIYNVGFCLSKVPMLSLRGKFGNKFRASVTLCYGRKYSEYYANIIWAQALSFALPIAAIFFLMAGMASGGSSALFAAAAVIAAALMIYYFPNSVKEKLNTRRDALEGEFPNAISKLALLVNSGVTLHAAWEMVAMGKEGLFYDRMKQSCMEMQNGKSEIDAIYEFGVFSGSDEIKKFVTALVSSMERGGGALPEFLVSQSTELWSSYRQYMLRKGEQAAGALLAPIGMMFVGIILIIVVAAMMNMGT